MGMSSLRTPVTSIDLLKTAARKLFPFAAGAYVPLTSTAGKPDVVPTET